MSRKRGRDRGERILLKLWKSAFEIAIRNSRVKINATQGVERALSGRRGVRVGDYPPRRNGNMPQEEVNPINMQAVTISMRSLGIEKIVVIKPIQ